MINEIKEKNNMDMQTLSRELDTIRLEPFKFSWGTVLKIHDVGQYNIVEYWPWKTRGHQLLVGTSDTSRKEFACYIDGKSIGTSALTFDEAIVICIARKHDGLNSQAASYFMKMIKNDEVK